jgi:hypothetical protein
MSVQGAAPSGPALSRLAQTACWQANSRPTQQLAARLGVGTAPGDGLRANKMTCNVCHGLCAMAQAFAALF